MIQCGAAVNVQDHDGWTPLHAAAHWGQREACELLCENYANMDVKNYVGQTCFDVADPGKLSGTKSLKIQGAASGQSTGLLKCVWLLGNTAYYTFPTEQAEQAKQAESFQKHLAKPVD